MFSLKSPHRGDSNENTQQTICNMEKKTILNYLESAAMGLKNEFELAEVNELSVFESLKVYFIIRRRNESLSKLYISTPENKE